MTVDGFLRSKATAQPTDGWLYPAGAEAGEGGGGAEKATPNVPRLARIPTLTTRSCVVPCSKELAQKEPLSQI